MGLCARDCMCMREGMGMTLSLVIYFYDTFCASSLDVYDDVRSFCSCLRAGKNLGKDMIYVCML